MMFCDEDNETAVTKKEELVIYDYMEMFFEKIKYYSVKELVSCIKRVASELEKRNKDYWGN